MARIAVLGAGIMGSCLALYLARKAFDVTLFDMAEAPLQGASRWNEGKIHLGYLYAGDPSLRTARRLLPGGLAFAPLVEDLTGCALEGVTEEDIYLIHRDSIVDLAAVRSYFDAVSEFVCEQSRQSRYPGGALMAARTLSRPELEAIAAPELVVAGFRTPERSVSTTAVADTLTAALASEPRIRLRMCERITRADPIGAVDGPWRVNGERFDWVINALWHGRLAVDATAGLAPSPGWSHRYRVSAFVRTSAVVEAPSAVLAVGPFGDMKNYNGRDFYLSWYPAGLLAEGLNVEPPQSPSLDAPAKKRIANEIMRGLAAALPSARVVFEQAESIGVAGGYVFAQGQGELGDPHATLHTRHLFGVRRLGRYLSIDTGKYSTAPLMARELSDELAQQ